MSDAHAHMDLAVNAYLCLYTWREKMSHPRGYVTITRVSTSVPEQSQEKSGTGRQLLPGAAIVQQVRWVCII